MICAVDRGMVQGHARRALRRHRAATPSRRVPHGRRRLRHRRRSLTRRGPPLPRPRVDVAAPARGARRRWSPWLASAAGRRPRPHPHRGPRGRVAVEEAREQVAALLGARRREVVFTSGAHRGHRRRRRGAPPSAGAHGRAAAVEHSAVRGVGGARDGEVDGRRRSTGAAGSTPTRSSPPIRPDTGARARAVGQPRGRHAAAGGRGRGARCRERGVLVHVDAAPGGRARADRLRRPRAPTCCRSAPTSSAARRASARCSCAAGCGCDPLLVGGDQERARRAGIENVPAHRRASAPRPLDGRSTVDAEARAARRLTERVRRRQRRRSTASRPTATRRTGLPHLVCLGIDGVEPQAVLLGLDQAGIAAHSGSACSSEALEPSPVLEAMGVDAHRSLRLSVGWSTTDADVDALPRCPSCSTGCAGCRPDHRVPSTDPSAFRSLS